MYQNIYQSTINLKNSIFKTKGLKAFLTNAKLVFAPWYDSFYIFELEEKHISYSEGVWVTEEQNVKEERCCAEHT